MSKTPRFLALSPIRADVPVHASRVIELPNHAWDAKFPPRFVLTGWTQRVWWQWERTLVPRSRHRDRIRVARVCLNGGGTDNELRFVVSDVRLNHGIHEHGCSNSFRSIPEGDPLRQSPTYGRIFGSRGVYPAQVGDALPLLDFCDRWLDRWYPSVEQDPRLLHATMLKGRDAEAALCRRYFTTARAYLNEGKLDEAKAAVIEGERQYRAETGERSGFLDYTITAEIDRQRMLAKLRPR